MKNKEFHKNYLIAYEDYKDNKEMMNEDCFRYNYKNHNKLSKNYIKENIGEYIDSCTDIQKLQKIYNAIKKHKKEKEINEWIESVRTIEDGDYVTDAFSFLWNLDDDDIWYEIAESLANILKYTIYESKHKDEHQEVFIEDILKNEC